MANSLPILNSPVWVNYNTTPSSTPTSSDSYISGTLIDISSNQTLTVQIIDPKSRKLTNVTVDFTQVFPAEDDPKKSHEDNCNLMYLNEATLLHNVKLRWEKGDIYVSYDFLGCLSIISWKIKFHK